MNTNIDKKKRVFRKHTFQGIDLDEILKMPLLSFTTLLKSNARRHILRGLSPREVTLIKKCLHAKQNPNEDNKIGVVRTHARSMVILPIFVGNLIAVYNGKVFVPLEVKPEMIGHRFSDYVGTKSSGGHGRPGVGATSSSKFVPLK